MRRFNFPRKPSVPIVYMGEDPVSLGLVPSLNRSGGNLTGVAALSSAVMAMLSRYIRDGELFECNASGALL